MLPFMTLFAAAIKLSAAPPIAGEVRIPGGRATIVVSAVLGSATTLVSMSLAFVPPPDEQDPVMAVVKVAVTTAALLLGGVGAYVWGNVRVRRAAAAAAV